MTVDHRALGEDFRRDKSGVTDEGIANMVQPAQFYDRDVEYYLAGGNGYCLMPRKGFLTLSIYPMSKGVGLPLHPFVRDVLVFYETFPYQLSAAAWCHLMGTLFLFIDSGLGTILFTNGTIFTISLTPRMIPTTSLHGTPITLFLLSLVLFLVNPVEELSSLIFLTQLRDLASMY